MDLMLFALGSLFVLSVTVAFFAYLLREVIK